MKTANQGPGRVNIVQDKKGLDNAPSLKEIKELYILLKKVYIQSNPSFDACSSIKFLKS